MKDEIRDEIVNNANYECAICGKRYESIEMRNACERNCLARKKEDQERLKKERLEGQKKERKDEIIKKIDEVRDLITSYTHDYGEFTYTLNKKGERYNLFDIFDLFNLF